MTNMNKPSSSQPSISEFEATIRQRAERLGTTMSELHARDREQFSIPDVSDDCLDPYEVEQLLSGDLSESRAAHLDDCTLCAAMIDVARPKEQWFDEFIKSGAAQNALKNGSIQKERNVWKPLVQASVLICGTLGFASVAFALYTIRLDDALLSMLISDSAPRSAALILAVALSCLLVVGSASRLPPASRFRFQESGGFAVGGLFACFASAYFVYAGLSIATSYGSIQNAQYGLLSQIAFAQNRGEIFSDSLYAEKLKYLPGSLVAQRDNQKFQISWEKPQRFPHQSERKLLGTVYEGLLKKDAAGESVLSVGKKAIEVDSGLLSAGIRYRNDTPILAVVPYNAEEASAIVPFASGQAAGQAAFSGQR